MLQEWQLSFISDLIGLLLGYWQVSIIIDWRYRMSFTNSESSCGLKEYNLALFAIWDSPIEPEMSACAKHVSSLFVIPELVLWVWTQFVVWIVFHWFVTCHDLTVESTLISWFEMTAYMFPYTGESSECVCRRVCVRPFEQPLKIMTTFVLKTFHIFTWCVTVPTGISPLYMKGDYE